MVFLKLGYSYIYSADSKCDCCFHAVATSREFSKKYGEHKQLKMLRHYFGNIASQAVCWCENSILWLYKKNTKKCDSKIHECQCTYSCYGHVSYSMFCTFFMIFVPETIELKSKYVGLFYLIGNSLEVSSIFT